MRKFVGFQILDCFDNEALYFEVDLYSTYITIEKDTDSENTIEIENNTLLKHLNNISKVLKKNIVKTNKKRIKYLTEKLTDFDYSISDKKVILVHKKYNISQIVPDNIYKQLSCTKFIDFVHYKDVCDDNTIISKEDFDFVHQNYK